MQIDKSIIVTIGGYDVDLTETVNLILAFLTKLLKHYIPCDCDEAE